MRCHKWPGGAKICAGTDGGLTVVFILLLLLALTFPAANHLLFWPSGLVKMIQFSFVMSFLSILSRLVCIWQPLGAFFFFFFFCEIALFEQDRKLLLLHCTVYVIYTSKGASCCYYYY
jgi:hypothetical protein